MGIKRIIEYGCYTILAYFNDNYVEGKKVISGISDPNVIANNVRTTQFVREINDDVKYFIVVPGNLLE